MKSHFTTQQIRLIRNQILVQNGLVSCQFIHVYMEAIIAVL